MRKANQASAATSVPTTGITNGSPCRGIRPVQCAATRQAGTSARATELCMGARVGVLLLVSLLALVGCSRLDMQDKPKYRPQRPSDFFADGRSERQPVEGTIARGALDEDTAFYEGKDAAGKDIEAFPIAVDKTVILRGQQRFDVYCAPCHGRIGNGLGMIVRRGF